MGRYDDDSRRSIADPEGFWAEAAEGIDWNKTWDKVLDESNAPFYRWFAGGQLNTCHNALDRHVAAGRGDQAGDSTTARSPTRSRPISYARAARPGGALRRGACCPSASARATG